MLHIIQRKIAQIFSDFKDKFVEINKIKTKYGYSIQNKFESNLKNQDENKAKFDEERKILNKREVIEKQSFFTASTEASSSKTSESKLNKIDKFATKTITDTETIDNSDKQSTAYSDNLSNVSSKNLSIPISQKHYELKELAKIFENNKQYKNSLVDLLEKIPKYFNKANEHEAMKFMSALENLV